jgi:hypothetical protein
MMLHEDYEGIGAYLYELNDTLDPGLGTKIIAAMGLHVPIDLRPEIEEARRRAAASSRGAILSPNSAGLKTFPSGPRRFISRSITPTWSTHNRDAEAFSDRGTRQGAYPRRSRR